MNKLFTAFRYGEYQLYAVGNEYVDLEVNSLSFSLSGFLFNRGGTIIFRKGILDKNEKIEVIRSQSSAVYVKYLGES